MVPNSNQPALSTPRFAVIFLFHNLILEKFADRLSYESQNSVGGIENNQTNSIKYQ
jgi:hypothetical protein